jgi:hypothetical protein
LLMSSSLANLRTTSMIQWFYTNYHQIEPIYIYTHISSYIYIYISSYTYIFLHIVIRCMYKYINIPLIYLFNPTHIFIILDYSHLLHPPRGTCGVAKMSRRRKAASNSWRSIKPLTRKCRGTCDADVIQYKSPGFIYLVNWQFDPGK